MGATEDTVGVKIIVFLLAAGVLANHNIPLFGNATLGYYYVEAYVGTPPQKQSLILDTGSHLTIFPCKGCTKCKSNHLYGLFDPAKSATFAKVDPTKTYFNWACTESRRDDTCVFEQGYSEGSVYNGYFAIDNFLFENEFNKGDHHSHKHIFGCAEVETNEFYRQQADGIIGIGVLTKDVYRNPPTIIDTEIIEGRIEKETFAICFAHNGGFLSLGSDNREQHLPSARPIKLDCAAMNWDDQFHVNFSGMKVDNESVEYEFNPLIPGSSKTFLDSGTTYVYFGSTLWHRIMDKFEKFCGQKKTNCGHHDKFKTCYKYDARHWGNKLQNFFASFPVLGLEFNQKDIINWYPDDYLIEKESDGGIYYCPGMKKLDSIILGATFMRNYDIHFNKVEKSVTFTRSNCGNLADFQANEAERSMRGLRKRGVSPEVTVASNGIVGPSEGVINQGNGTAKSGILQGNSSAGAETIKLKPDLAGFEVVQNATTNMTTYQRSAPINYLFYYVIIFALLVLFLVILMIRFMM